MKKLVLISIIIFLSCSLFAQRTISLNRLIIDTDCAIDDFRAINILLSRPEIKIAGFIASEGTLMPAEGAEKIRSLLQTWHADSIPVVSGNEINGAAPPWREFNRKIEWGKPVTNKNIKGITDLIRLLDAENEARFTLVCLGTLNTARTIAKEYPEFFKKINRITWYTQSVYPLKGFNYEYDKSSAEYVIKNERIRIDVISNLSYPEALFDETLLNTGNRATTHLSESIADIFEQTGAIKKLHQHHFELYDDLVAIYLLIPELFNMNIKMTDIRLRFNQSYDLVAVREVLTDMMNGDYVHEKNIVFNAFPRYRQMFNYDVRQIMDSTIKRYGNDEWKACVMTDEFHGHLGVFSIVGAKMGIKARELFHVGPDQLSVLTFAGTTPPYSCLNDGIQVSTGATLGQGLIEVATDSITRPEAVFNYMGKSIKITLKEAYLKKVNNDISEGIVKYGLSDDGYWKFVRKSALNYWLNWDRNEIFNITYL